MSWRDARGGYLVVLPYETVDLTKDPPPEALEDTVKRLRAEIEGWRHHAEHLERGERGEEQTIGCMFFNPIANCSICRAWHRSGR